MRNLAIIFILIISFCQSLKAQYSVERKKFDSGDYVRDPNDKYSPAFAGVASYFIPGLGQIYCNEPLRGGGFMALYTVDAVILINQLSNKNIYGIMYSAAGLIAIQIADIIDAVEVAKVKDLALRAKTSGKLNLNLKPYLDRDLYGGYGTGLTLCLQFN